MTRTLTTSSTIPTVVSVPATGPSHSSVIRAVADANQKSAEKAIQEQRELAHELSRAEAKAKISDAIAASVADEEKKVIDAANKRMAEVHARREAEATKAAKAIEEAREIAKRKMDQAREEERAAIEKVVATHARNVVA